MAFNSRCSKPYQILAPQTTMPTMTNMRLNVRSESASYAIAWAEIGEWAAITHRSRSTYYRADIKQTEVCRPWIDSSDGHLIGMALIGGGAWIGRAYAEDTPQNSRDVRVHDPNGLASPETRNRARSICT